jgi:hypothetical protein
MELTPFEGGGAVHGPCGIGSLARMSLAESFGVSCDKPVMMNQTAACLSCVTAQGLLPNADL